ncbi:hypothetical protein WMZ97_07425 [Lentibacillus sp. N15]
MGDVYWMTAILIVQAIVSTVICIVLTKKTESIVDRSKDEKI